MATKEARGKLRRFLEEPTDATAFMLKYGSYEEMVNFGIKPDVAMAAVLRREGQLH
jgi:hypothetical protein